MEQNIKNTIKNMREEIMALEQMQRSAKEQRKTVSFHGERTMPCWVAAECVNQNRIRLRIMYAAYGLLRGKKFSQIEKNAKPTEDGKHPLIQRLSRINEFLEKYGYGLPFETKKNWYGQEYKVFNEENCEEVICLNQQEA